jgi:peptidoglycan/xylan/chitin deacetylase (PgdA/CDA1 family)
LDDWYYHRERYRFSKSSNSFLRPVRRDYAPVTFVNRTASRREFLQATVAAAGLACAPRSFGAPTDSANDTAQIAITLDLEMARNFPNWTDTRWDYEKGNLNEPAKQYAVEACRRVKARGGRIHTFVVGQVFEQADVDWLKEIAAQGHPIGNHTYDHVYLLAKTPAELQFRFQRAPWLIRGRQVADVIRDNIQLTNIALKERVGVEANGFRTPGGFTTGLHGREDLQQLLLSLGFDWISSIYPAHAGIVDIHASDATPSQDAYDNIVAAQSAAQPQKYPTGLIEIPMSPISDIGAFRNGRWKLEHFLEALRRELDWVIRERAVFDFLSHPSCLGVVDPEFKAIDLICDRVQQSNGAAKIVTLNEIAASYKAKSLSDKP